MRFVKALATSTRGRILGGAAAKGQPMGKVEGALAAAKAQVARGQRPGPRLRGRRASPAEKV
eukprot:3438104-Alexandrium_andersonii.AAC.1